MTMKVCTIHLLSLRSDTTIAAVLEAVVKGSPDSLPYVLKGRPRGWIHRPHRPETKYLTDHDWNLFLLTPYSELPGDVYHMCSAYIAVRVSIPESQYDELVFNLATTPHPVPDTPPLPNEWPREGGIPQSLVSTNTVDAPLRPGELQLDRRMADFLSNVLPTNVANRPVSLMNLFKYPNGDTSVHDAYMEGFKTRFGPAAGAFVKFMGPVDGDVDYYDSPFHLHVRDAGHPKWEDANLVQYDTIWHYAYMLSTEVYADLNKEKMRGLEDTCILCVSEVELVDGV